MFPVISIGPFGISSYGVFLSLGFLFGVFLVWRLSRAWDLDEEKALDLTILTFLGGLIGARIYFILENIGVFGLNILKFFHILKYPGLSFWGAILGGVLTLRFFAKKFKINFWQALDIASVGFLGGIIFADIGCFLGGCNFGLPSKFFFALPVSGVLDKRIPVQAVEAILFALVFLRAWEYATHFHIRGSVFSLFLIYIGAIKLITEPLRAHHSFGSLLNVILVGAGILFFYKLTKRRISKDLKFSVTFLIKLTLDPATRKGVIAGIKKSWYNYMVSIKWKLRLLPKILRRINVYFSHKNSKYY